MDRIAKAAIRLIIRRMHRRIGIFAGTTLERRTRRSGEIRKRLGANGSK